MSLVQFDYEKAVSSYLGTQSTFNTHLRQSVYLNKGGELGFRFVCFFGDCALVRTILGIQHLLFYTPPTRCMLQSILRNL